MLSKIIAPEHTTSGTVRQRAIRPTKFAMLSCCCGLCLLIIIASLIVLTTVPMFLPAKGNQTRYQVKSDLLILIYDLPHDGSVLPAHLTYSIGELPSNKFSILQTMLQKKLSETRATKKTTITVAGAHITSASSSSPSSITESQVDSFDKNITTITVYRTQKEQRRHSAAQLNISLVLRYSLECTKKCQNILKESIFGRTFNSLQFTIRTFKSLLTEAKNTTMGTSPQSTLPSSTILPLSTSTPIPCIVNKTLVWDSDFLWILARLYEAESSRNTFTSPNDSQIEPCSFCSGRQKVSHVGFTADLIFDQIESQYGGSTLILFYYITDRIRSAEITVNNRMPPINVTFPSTATLQTPGSLPLMLDLCQGINFIRISNSHEFAPDFDRIEVY